MPELSLEQLEERIHKALGLRLDSKVPASDQFRSDLLINGISFLVREAKKRAEDLILKVGLGFFIYRAMCIPV